MTLRALPHILALAPYPLVEPPEGDLDILSLGGNEHWEGPSETVIAAATQAALNCHLYPETSAARLRREIAACYDIEPDRIVCANGSSELITLLCQLFCAPGDEVVLGSYSYLYFKMAVNICGAKAVSPNHNRLTLSVDDLIEKVTEKTKIVFIDNPQNPIGGYLSGTTLAQLRRRLPEDVLLVIDAAYAEYVIKDDYDAGLELTRESDNCVMLRTFSKIHALAGFRIGWAYTSTDIVDLLNRTRQPNNLSIVSIEAARAAIQDRDQIRQRRENTRHYRHYLDQSLTALGFNVLSSEANFLLAGLPNRCSMDAAELSAALESKKIIIKPMASYQLPHHIRITIGPINQMNRLVNAIREILLQLD